MQAPVHDLPGLARHALQRMLQAGFDDALVTAGITWEQELALALNEPQMLRSTERHSLSLWGMVEGRKASTELSDLSDSALEERLPALLADAASAPRDEANAVSSGQQADLVQGPMRADREQLVGCVSGLLAYRADQTPQVILQEGAALHVLQHTHTVSSRGTELAGRMGCYSLNFLGTAREGGRASSFNTVHGDCHALDDRPAQEHFGIAQTLHDMQAQVHTQTLAGKFEGDVILTPNAVRDLMQWLLGQLGDVPLISGSSLYRDRVGQQVASPLLNLRSRLDAPGCLPLSIDGFLVPQTPVLEAGRLMTLTPSLYGSRKTGLPHRPVPAQGGWTVAAGDTPLPQLLAGVRRGALVGRLSMGMPSPGGEFAGVIKNSFLLEGGMRGPALAETMIAGNVARMLQQVVAVSRERIDTGAWELPWLHVQGLHFS